MEPRNTSSSLLRLGTLDATVPPCYISFVVAFKHSGVTIEDLDRGFEHSRGSFPSLFGHLVRDDDSGRLYSIPRDVIGDVAGSHSYVDIADCGEILVDIEEFGNDPTSYPIKAHELDATFHKLNLDEATSSELLEEHNLRGISVVTAPLTRLELYHVRGRARDQEGQAIVIKVHHCICDGRATAELLSCIADNVVGRRQTRDPQPTVAFLNATEHPAVNNGSHSSSERVLGLSAVDMSRRGTPPSEKKCPAETPSLQCKTVHFNIEKLESFSAGRDFSKNDLIGALLWRAITRARLGSSISSETESTLSHAVDVRRRVRPTLRSGYPGNAVLFSEARASAQTLTECTLEGVASQSKQSVVAVTNESIQRALQWVDAQPGHMLLVNPFMRSFMGADVAISSWRHLPFNSVDFGYGKPCASGVPHVTIPFDGMAIVLFPSGTSGARSSIRVLFGLRTEQMEMVLRDTELLSFLDKPPL